MEHIILKIKYLMRLSVSANENEAANALSTAQKLMEKHGITEEQVSEKEAKPIYTDDELLHQDFEEFEWIDQLTFAIADKYDCYIIKEKTAASTGNNLFKYFVYGDATDSIYVKRVFELLHKEMIAMIVKSTVGRGKLFIESYSEGLTNGVKVNLMFEDFEMTGLVEVKESKEDEPALVKVDGEDRLAPPLKEKQEVKKSGREKPLDIMAYFRGEGDGRNIHIGNRDDLDVAPDLMVGLDMSRLFGSDGAIE